MFAARVMVPACGRVEHVQPVGQGFKLDSLRAKTTCRGDVLLTSLRIDEAWRIHVELTNRGTFDRFVALELRAVDECVACEFRREGFATPAFKHTCEKGYF